MSQALVWLSPAAKDLLRAASLLTKGSVPCPAAQFAKLLAETECDGTLSDSSLRKALAAKLEKAGGEVSDAGAAKLVDVLQTVLDEQAKAINGKADAFAKKLGGKGLPPFADVAKLLPKGEQPGELLWKDTMVWHAVGHAQDSKSCPAPSAKIMKSRLALAACAGSGPVADYVLAQHVLDNLGEYVNWEKSFPGSNPPAVVSREVGLPFNKKVADEVAIRRVLSQALPMDTATAVAAKGGDTLKVVTQLAEQARKEAVVPMYAAPPAPAKGKEAKEAKATGEAGKEPKAKPVAAGAYVAMHNATVSKELQWHLLAYRLRPQTTLSQSASTSAAPVAAAKSPKAAAAQASTGAVAKGGNKVAGTSGGFVTTWQPTGQELPPGHTNNSWLATGVPSGFPTTWATGVSAVPPGHTDFSWAKATGSTSKPAGGKKEKASKKEDSAAKPPAESAKPAAAGAPSEGGIDVSWGDIRVGVILEAKAHPESDKLCVETIDVGEEKPRQILSGILNHMKIENVKGAKVVVICNLKSRKLAGLESNGMVLCAHDADRKELAFVVPPAGAKPGDRVTFDGFPGEAASVKQMDKKKGWEAIAPELTTNAKGVACYKGVAFTLTGGACTSPIKDGQVS